MGLTKLVRGVSDTGDLFDNVNGLINGVSSSPMASGKLMGKLSNNTGNCNVLVVSDSTGNAEFEWVYLYSLWIAESFPSHTVNYYLWDELTNDYAEPVTISAGTGVFSFNMYNASIPGSKVTFLMGDKFNESVRRIPKCDLVFINHGHNMIPFYATLGDGEWGKVCMYQESIAMIKGVHQDAGFIMLTQNPRRDDDQYAPVYRSIVTAAGMINADIADSYSIFKEAGKPASWYLDNIHPTGEGVSAYLDSIKSIHQSKSHKTVNDFINNSKKSFLLNGDFSAFSASIPDSWTLSSGMTSTKDTVNFEGKNAYSVKLTVSVASGDKKMTQTIPSSVRKELNGNFVTLAAWIYIPDGNSETCGVISITSNENSSYYGAMPDQRNGWHWRVITTYIPENSTFIQVNIGADSVGVVGSNISVGKVILCKGRLPSDINTY